VGGGHSLIDNKNKEQEEQAIMAKEKNEDIVTVDMTDAVTFEVIAKGTPCLGTISEWKTGKSASEGNKIHCVTTVLEPEKYKNRKIFTDTSIDNEYGKGTMMQIIMGALKMSEKDIRTKKFVIPSSDDMVGQQIAFVTGVRIAKEGSGFSDQNTLTRIRPGESYVPAEPA
jgi:hypothetical protein